MATRTKRDRAAKHDYGKLEQAFNEAVAGLPTYKRQAAFAFVLALQDMIEARAEEINELADMHIIASEG